MSNLINIEYANAYAEVLEVLNHMSKKDYEKIPKDLISLFQNNYNKEYQFIYDFEKQFEEQNFSKRAKLILAILFRDYWATPNQRDKIITKQNYDRKKQEEQKRKKYNLDNIFQNNNVNREMEKKTNTNNIAIIKYKESILKKIIVKIKNIFRVK